MNIQDAEDSLANYISSFKDVTTTNGGIAEIQNVEYGLYVLIEWDVSHATIGGKPASLTNTQSPFLVALPTSVTENGVTYWNENVNARIKNSSDEAEVEKKIVTDKETLTTGDETVDDTDTTSIGDIVHFRLKGTVPTIPEVDNGNQQKFNKYVLVDNLSKGLTPETATVNGTVQLKDMVVRTTNVNADYTLAAEDYTTTITDYEGNEPEYAGGKTITVTLTDSGLTKISKWAADEKESKTKEIYFYYTAVVNEYAEIGPNDQAGSPAGNPNEVQLRYKIGSSADMETEWDKVTEYTFGIDANKQLGGSATTITDANKEQITFVLYSTKSGTADASDKTYYEMEKTTDDVYHVTSVTKNSVTDNAKMHPAAGGALNIKGLEEGTYFLEELSTVSGYNILKAPVKIEIKANRDENTYVGSNNQYIGTISQDSNTDGIFKVTINNTKGFELPSTGGSGIWFFVLAGAFAVAAGCGYYSMSIRKNRAK